MYRIYLIICVLSGVVLGDSHEAKYIDLLPEEEKQEFLNRIARRIIEEIQNKDSPEQSQTEVSDDQLNQHHNYVRDLIKQESENMRSERDIAEEKTDNIKSSTVNYGLEKDKLEKTESDENSDNIDLTLREDKYNENIKIIPSDSSKVDVIPVKVIYDEDVTEVSRSTTDSNYSEVSDVSINPDNITDIADKSHYYNNKEIESGYATDIRQNFSENVDNIHGVLRDQHQVKENKQEKFISSEFSTDETLVVDNSRESIFDKPFEITETSTNSDIGSYTGKQTRSEVDITYTTFLPLTVKADTKFASNSSTETSMLSSISPVSMISTSSETENPTKERKNIDHDDIASTHTDKTDQDKIQKSTNSTEAETSLRSKLDNFANRKRHQNVMSRKKNVKKEYFVYEVSEEKQHFVQMPDSKVNEQPYVVPIYNFAPNNAYYNPYNHFGPNSDGDVKLIKHNLNNNKEELLDKEMYLRNGVEIDLNPKRLGRSKYKEQQNRFVERRILPYSTQVLNSFFDKNRSYKGHKKLSGETKRHGSYQNIDRYNRPPIHPFKPLYISLRKNSHSHSNGQTNKRKKHKKLKPIEHNLPSSDENDHPYNSIHKYVDHIRAIKNLFYKQQNFGFLLPFTFNTTVEPSHKRFFDGGEGLDYNKDNKKKNTKSKAKNIAMDYYFGRLALNKTGEDFDDVYPDSDDTEPIQSKNIKHFVNKQRKLYAKHYRIERDDDCERGCIENKLKSDYDFERYLDIVIRILKDMIYTNKRELVFYDWLLSTVDMKSAVTKLLELIKNIENGNRIHPLDARLLKYIVYLHSLAKNTVENKLQTDNKSNAFQDINYIVESFLNLLRYRIVLPKNKNKKHGDKIRNPIRVWYQYYIRKGDYDDNSPLRNAEVLRSFKTFLMDLEDNMFDLHNALKHLALITTYRAQNWYEDLKNIYFKTASKKELLEVILHLAASRLFSSIEETAEKAEEADLSVTDDRDVVRRIRNEFIFVLKILQVIKKVDY